MTMIQKANKIALNQLGRKIRRGTLRKFSQFSLWRIFEIVIWASNLKTTPETSACSRSRVQWMKYPASEDELLTLKSVEEIWNELLDFPHSSLTLRWERQMMEKNEKNAKYLELVMTLVSRSKFRGFLSSGIWCKFKTFSRPLLSIHWFHIFLRRAQSILYDIMEEFMYPSMKDVSRPKASMKSKKRTGEGNDWKLSAIDDLTT